MAIVRRVSGSEGSGYKAQAPAHPDRREVDKGISFTFNARITEFSWRLSLGMSVLRSNLRKLSRCQRVWTITFRKQLFSPGYVRTQARALRVPFGGAVRLEGLSALPCG